MIRRAPVVVLVVAALTFLPVAASAMQFVVGPSGNDSAAGTAAAPWKTLQHAANVVGPGDHVTVNAGNYVGFNLTTSGTAAAPIVFEATPGVAITQRNSVTPDGINLEGASYVTVENFTVNNMPRTGIRTVGDPDNPAKFVTLEHNFLAGNQMWGILTGFVDDLDIDGNSATGSVVQHGIYVSNSGDRPIVRDNLVVGNHDSGIQINADINQGGDGIITGAVVSGNIIFNNGTGGGSAINLDGVQNSRVENNLLYNNHFSGISLYQIDGAQPSKNNTVVNNTIDQASDGQWAMNIQDGSTGNTLRNNIFVSSHPFRGAIDISSDSLSGFSSDYNAVISRFTTDGGNSVKTLAQWQTATGQDAHSLVSSAAALVQSPSNGNYRLPANSPAVDAGTSLDAPAIDLDHKPRPLGAAVDIGAYEFGAFLFGDYNHNGIVDAADYTVWRDSLGSTVKLDADGNVNHMIDASDYDVWKANFGTSGSGAGDLASVPEPASIVLFLPGMLFVRSRLRPWKQVPSRG
jgi:hypothetical protein